MARAQPAAADLLRRHRLLRAGPASAMGLSDLPPPVTGDWLADPAHWQRLRQRLAAAVAAHAARDPLAAGLPVDAARAELGLPDRDLVEALAAWRPPGGTGQRPIEADGGYRPRRRQRRTGDRERRIPAPRRAGGETALMAPDGRPAPGQRPSGGGTRAGLPARAFRPRWPRGPGGAGRPGRRAVQRAECRTDA